LILILALVSTSSDIVEGKSKFFAKKNLDPFIFNIIKSLGYSLSFILFIIYTIRNKRKNIKEDQLLVWQNNINKISWKKKILWILLASIISFISSLLDSFFWINEGNNYLNLWTFYIIFLSLFSYWILKNKLYKHHYISIIIIVIIGFLYNVVLDKFSKKNIEKYYKYYLTNILNGILYSLVFVLYKYMMINKFIKSYEILFFEGLFESILSIITLIVTTNCGLIDNFWDFIDDLDKKEIIIYIGMIFAQFAFYSFKLIIIDIFTVFYIFLLNILSELMIFIFYMDKFKKTIVILSFFCISFILFITLVFIELIELNFCGLSHMTKNNMEIRARIESMDDKYKENNDSIDYEGYSIELDNDLLPPSDDNTHSDN
jgi:hypothetical protein